MLKLKYNPNIQILINVIKLNLTKIKKQPRFGAVLHFIIYYFSLLRLS